MEPGVALVLLTKLDSGAFLPLSREILGYSPASAADSLGIPLKELPHSVACIASFKDKDIDPHLKSVSPYFSLFNVGFLIAADERDMTEILELTGMAYIRTETLSRGIEAAVISGSLIQWRDAVKLACSLAGPRPSHGVRHAFNSVYNILLNNGMQSLFEGLQVTNLHDRTFLLKHN